MSLKSLRFPHHETVSLSLDVGEDLGLRLLRPFFLTGATLLIPLAYCKYGCPTGALFHFLRKTGASDRFLIRDLLAGAPCLAEGIFSD